MEPVLIGGDAEDVKRPADEIGSKAANLARLARIGLRVPPAFVLDTACVDASFATEPGCPTRRGRRCGAAWHNSGDRRGANSAATRRCSCRCDRAADLDAGHARHGAERRFDGVSHARPPEATGNPSFVWDTSRRFAQAFAETVWGAPSALFAREMTARSPRRVPIRSVGWILDAARIAPVRRRSSLTRSADHLFPMIRTRSWRRQSRPCSGHGRPLARVTIAV